MVIFTICAALGVAAYHSGTGASQEPSAPTFSNPTEITNPLFPISRLRSVVFSGRIDGKPFHTETTYSDKVFAPGYGEFFTGDKGEVEALALAVPTDALNGLVPVELKRLSRAASRVLYSTRSRRWR